jgi:hypothetical protein
MIIMKTAAIKRIPTIVEAIITMVTALRDEKTLKITRPSYELAK